MKGMIANLITGCRIIFSLVMLFFPISSPAFGICYLSAGITDMVDGTVARKLGTTGEFGEKFDTIADIIFVAAALYKLLPAMKVGIAIWIWVGVIAAIKVFNIACGFVKQKQLVAVHSWANKITGLVLFILPMTLPWIDIKYTAVAACLVATLAAIQESGKLWTTKEF